jgi:deazaflavin-dependent oxidoreductase (nitroreductase family)
VTDKVEPTISPTGWVADHTRRYLDTDGADGHLWRGVPTLLLTTIGRSTGVPRRTALIYRRDSDRYLLVASVGGADKHPQWYLNLLKNSDVQIQVGADRFAARARPATPEEKPHLWTLMTAIWPDYDRYQARTKREIPVVVVERA